jgi:hypothetical protein
VRTGVDHVAALVAGDAVIAVLGGATTCSTFSAKDVYPIPPTPRGKRIVAV